jgi:hypothetical protein
MEYEIWFAKTPQELFYPRAKKATLHLTHELGNPINANDLEDCFQKGQDRANERSVSVGDVIQGPDRDYLVLPYGFLVIQ